MFVIGYPKSGNTWLCYLLAYCLNAQFDNFDDPGPHNINGEFMEKYLTGRLSHHSYQGEIGKLWKTHQLNILNRDNQPVIYLVRDGRDVMVSYYFYKNYYLKNNRGGVEIDEKEKISNFIKSYTLEWINHVKEGLKLYSNIIVRYEDLKESTELSLSEIFEKLKLRISLPIIRESIEIFDFKNIANRKPGKEERSSFFRKGIVGDWKNHFSKDDLKFFYRKAKYVLNRLGYII
jgi:hypothetical protein